MASPPFDIDTTEPGDSDIASQYPAQERTFRDIVESWLLTEHNTTGTHDKVTLVGQGSPLAGVDNSTRVYADTSGTLIAITGSAGNAEFVGVPAGVIVPFGGTSAPNGWLFTYGQLISRTTYARLFAAIGTTYGVGDGSTTFGLPDIRGRVVAGQDDMGGVSANRLTSPLDGDTLGAAGGAESVTLVKANLPNVNTDAGANHFHYGFNTTAATNADTQTVDTNTYPTRELNDSSRSENYRIKGTATAATVGKTSDSGNLTLPLGGSDTPHANVQPTIILNYIIRT